MFTGDDDMEGVGEVRPEHRIDVGAIAEWLAKRTSVSPPLLLAQFKGGQSNPTYLVTDAVGRRFVLRRKPPGNLLGSAHQVEREYRVMRALGPTGLPVPSLIGLCQDPDLIGSTFYVMDFVPGRSFWDHTLPHLPIVERQAVYVSMISTLGKLHRIEPAAVGLADLGPPNDYVARQIKRWTAQYRASEHRPIPKMEELIPWVTAHAPSGEPGVLIHGDFRLDNLIFDQERPDVVAILDWEISTIGDPLADLAFQLFPYWLPPEMLNGLAGVHARLGLPSEAEQIRRYERVTGRTVGAVWPLYRIYTLFRLAAIFQGIEGRVRDGTNSNPRARGLMGYTEPLASLALDHVERWEKQSV